ncbi:MULTISPECIES: hypothetical protein [unclassified Leeuwenhoekiella]|uniref:hypothetical protein n=1 Tax=unclassified Leeuwenhoekiella TaxID=2615029 RepID=UPI000C41510D|nr:MULTISPECIES: hypothetical protein [unclassified Leeuwenhoekiella]MAW97128.1 hypothetical protein [Leeuwenhoekiella sp.]MBA82644.1 hypothetical protein [Leeuwenhoekiella sp.]|tara:strand:+ start:21859 stop:22044 length:186 start_codon:yes stop_codon:yes gene_type:complete
MFDFIPESLQPILIIVVLAVLFFAVMANNRKNQSKLREHRKRNFRADYTRRKAEREKSRKD